jgi:hypothetical protein
MFQRIIRFYLHGNLLQNLAMFSLSNYFMYLYHSSVEAIVGHFQSLSDTGKLTSHLFLVEQRS